MNFHKLTGLELQQARYIWSQSFENGARSIEEWDAWEARTPDGRTTYGVVTEAGLQAAIVLVDERVHYGEAELPMSAVCGVGVLPASRGRGLAGSGLLACFERMREGGFLLSYLEPFSWEFYGRLGYAWTAPTRKYVVPARVLPPSPETERVRLAGPADHGAVEACYAALARRYRGMMVRRPALWAWHFDASPKHTTYTYIYEADGRTEGYVQMHGGSSVETCLDELIALTPRARRGLLGLLRRHAMQTERFRWEAPADDPLWIALAHRELETSLRSRLMARIVDVEGALAALSPPAGLAGALTLQVIDATAPWNGGVRHVEVEGGSVAVSAGAGPAQVTLPVQALAQAYLGSPGLTELRAEGLVTVADDAAFALLASLLAGPPAWCCDRF
ncbi:MAG TPA: GNAT family N-acetyltransferase [Chthonomonadaceae bacterium]|nr:GNAT family N-acetyltransferase [Chthonomonadaceae bacterium]